MIVNCCFNYQFENVIGAFKIFVCFCTRYSELSPPRGVTKGKRGAIPEAPSHYGGAKSLRGSRKSPNNITSTLFNTVHLLPKDLSFGNMSAPSLLLSPGAIYLYYAPECTPHTIV